MCLEDKSIVPRFLSQPPAKELGQINNERGQNLVRATPQEVTDHIVRRERKQLEAQLKHDEDDQNKKAKFIEEALGLFEKWRNQLAAQVRPQKRGNSAEVSAEDLDKIKLEEQEVHYFYQAHNGQNIYLHNDCFQMLKHEYGSLQAAPRVLSGTIIQQETYSMTHELRSDLRYLRHLPVTTAFVVVKVELDDVSSAKKRLIISEIVFLNVKNAQEV
ncbi:hypothetical protein QYM36_007092 [Artemia franciscana]|uniref:Uncharacterized protein n=3 Tax=Artemia franciscana TaxID=6661 RepID=A0AA88HV39_ARTSF|nr:hypothetical protein QYM36_007092 [Artemia franciscana]